MFAPLPTFAVPPVLKSMGLAPPVFDREAGTVPLVNWLGTADDASEGLGALVDGLGHLIAALALAGYEVDQIAATPLVGGASTEHVVIDPAERWFTYIQSPLDAAVLHAMPVAELCLACYVVPRRRFRSYVTGQVVSASLAMPLPGLAVPAGSPPSGWNGTGAVDSTWDVVHDPAPIVPDGGGWWLIGLSGGTDGGLDAMASAAADVSSQLAEIIAIDIASAVGADAPLPGLLGIFDADTWHFPDGSSPFADRLVAAANEIQAWLGRPAKNQSIPPHAASAAERLDFFDAETWNVPSNASEHALDVATDRAAGAIMIEGIASGSEKVAVSSPIASAPTLTRLRTVFKLPWSGVLMALHMYQIVDVLGREQVGAVADSESIDIDGTGFFEQRSANDPTTVHVDDPSPPSDDTGLGTEMLEVNIAGKRLVGYWQERSSTLTGPRFDTSWEIDAWRRVDEPAFDGTCTNVDTGAVEVCEIHISAPGHLVVVDLSLGIGAAPDQQTTFARVGSASFMSDADIDRFGPDLEPRIREMQRHPLHSTEVFELLDISDALRSDIDGYLAGALTPQDVEANFQLAIRPWYDTSHGAAAVGDHIEQARLLLHQDLGGHEKSTGWFPFTNHTADYTERLQTMVNTGGTFPALLGFFELDVQIFKYEWDLHAPPIGGGGANVAIGATLYLYATMTIRKWEYQSGSPVLRWEATFWAIFGGGGHGPAFELTSGLDQSGRSKWVRHDVESDWFIGAFASVSAQGGLSAGPLAPTWQWLGLPSFLYRWRDQSVSSGFFAFGPRVGNPDGSNVLWTYSGGTSTLKGSYMGLEFAFTLGRLFPWTEGEDPPEIDPYELMPDGIQVSEVEYTEPSNGDRFFDTDVSLLDDETRGWLRDLCLENLHLLRDRTGSLAVVGHADPQGEDDDNEKLSIARAQSVYQAFSDFLGPHLLIPEERTFIGGHGEWESLGETFPELFAGDRRVDIFLAGQRIISMRPLGVDEVVE